MAASMVASIAAPIVADTIENLVGMIGQKLVIEGSLVTDFREDFQWLTEKLTFMKAYVKDAHQKSTQKELIKHWLSKLDDVVFDAEDIVEECVVESRTSKSHTFLTFKHEIGGRIEDLKARMSSIVAEAKELRLLRDLNPSEQAASTSSSGAERWKKSSILERNARPVAIQDKVDEIIRLLDDDTHQVIGVVGMGGVGKTFLLQNVYNDPRTKRKFEIYIWLSISQTYSLPKLQADLASNLNLKNVEAGHVSEQRAVELIYRKLQKKKFLIVLDDVWRTTKEDNLIERLGVPPNTESKIVVTTRNKKAICREMNAYLYNMEVLKKEDSWNLFCVYAFPDNPENKPPQYLNELARQVENECGKLPLALKIVGASMADKSFVAKWESKLYELKALRKLEDPIQDILQLSYDSLPAYLKPCFLYFSFFGEDEEIDVEYLIELWSAEGFIPERDARRNIGLKWFYELSNLCLIEAREELSFDQKYCKLHDLVLDLAVHICAENKCIVTLKDRCTEDSPSSTQSLSRPDKSSGCRRIFLAKQGITDTDISSSKLIFPRALRTLSLGTNDTIKVIPARIFSEVRALRVLDLSYTRISTLPSSIACLKLLKVLNLSETQITELPQCIASLKNLRVLRVRSGVRRVPEWISELECLEHLSIIQAASVAKTTSELHSLRVLDISCVKLSVEENGLLRLEDIRNLIRLQEVYIHIHCEGELQRMKEGVLEHLVNMRWLTVFNNIPTMGDSNDVPLFPEKLTSMTHLEFLWVHGFVVPSASICDLVNLTALTLNECHCIEYPAVESLPNLISLTLWRNKKCKKVSKLFGKRGAFSKLRFLDISEFPLLEELLVLEEGNMPRLEKFILVNCRSVGRVEGLERLESLKTFDFTWSGTDECKESLREGGEQWKRLVAKNPHVKIIAEKNIDII